MSVKLLSYSDLAAKGIPYRKAHLRRLIVAGEFPQAVAIGDGKNGVHRFLESEIDEFIAAKIAARPTYRAKEAA
jgi:predicted DNA-binding transcriptional regulator AlpA